MSTTGLDVFDTTVQKTNNWLNDLMQVLRWPDKHKVYLALGFWGWFRPSTLRERKPIAARSPVPDTAG